jgi:hypothetical protein
LDRLDRSRLRMYPLAERDHKLDFSAIAVHPDDPAPAASKKQGEQIARTAERIAAARGAGRPVILTYGAHLIKNGLSPVAIRLIEDGWITHVATNGAGSIHDWEFAFLGLSTEDVRANTGKGQFGTWEETGRHINLAVAAGGTDGLGYGQSVGRMIAEDGLYIPSRDKLRAGLIGASKDASDERIGALADLLYLASSFDLPEGKLSIPHQHKEYSVQHAAWKCGIPFTVHPGIGYDIIYTHPMSCGGAIGRAAMRDFLSYAESVSRMGGGGVHISVGSAVMAPMIFEKSMSMANNLSIGKTGMPLRDYYLTVVDIADGGDWDWSKGEPPENNPAYYLRFCKSFYRMGGDLDYVCMDNTQFMLGLCKALSRS